MEVTWGLVMLIACLYFAVTSVTKSKQTQDAIVNKQSADDSAAEIATVIRILPGENSSQVLFEKENGERVNLSVPQEKCVFLEGETGWLKEAANTFSSFTKEKPQDEQEDKTAAGERPSEVLGKPFVCEACGKTFTGWYKECPDCHASGKMKRLE